MALEITQAWQPIPSASLFLDPITDTLSDALHCIIPFHLHVKQVVKWCCPSRHWNDLLSFVKANKQVIKGFLIALK